MNSLKFWLSIFLYVTCIYGVYGKSLPSYIHVCKRDPETINNCVKEAIEVVRPRLANGIPELKVPGIEPFIINELVLSENNELFKAKGKDLKVYGASNFKVKHLSVNLDTLLIKARVTIPRLFIEGKYDVDASILVIPIRGKGNMTATATQCLADVLLQAETYESNGVEYIRFKTVDLDIEVKDYTVKLSNLFDGNPAIGDVANQIINSNKEEILKTSMPYLEKAISSMFKRIANKIVTGIPYEELFPHP